MSLEDLIKARIAQDGPISIADYMAECLLHPDFGYYTTRAPFGAAGDFITAPEISQMFGELIGLSLAQAWTDQGSPANVTLAELGPGRGTLMRDALRAVARIPGFSPTVTLIEVSPQLRDTQRETLANVDVQWVERLSDLAPQPLLLIANEFFDALPIRQFQRGEMGWREVRIGIENGALTRGLGQEQAQPALAARMDDTRPGDLVEYCAPAAAMAEEVSKHIARHGGAALIIDYGDWRALGDTWQALRGHAPTDPLTAPGTADLTAHVDFETLATAVRVGGAAHSRITPQGVFLERLGITPRAQTLAQNLTGTALQTHIAAHRRLTHPAEMGNLFKVMGVAPKDSALPPGLEA